MNIVEAWQQNFTGKGIVVTILDDGLERTHQDLHQNYVSAALPHYLESIPIVSHYLITWSLDL